MHYVYLLQSAIDHRRLFFDIVPKHRATVERQAASTIQPVDAAA